MRVLSDTALQAINAEATGEIPLFLLRIFPPSETDPANAIRLVNSAEDVESDSLTYTAFRFDVQLPDDQEGSLPSVNLVLDNVGQELASYILTWTEPVNVEIELVLESSPDTIEAGPWFFIGAAAVVRGGDISIELRYENVLDEPYPADRITPQKYPSLFAR